MCANYKPPSSPQLSLFDSPPPPFDSVSEAFPSDLCPILVSGSDHHFAWRQAVFGLVPEWANDLKFSKHTYNARMETVATKPSYRSAWRNNQFALIPMQSFSNPVMNPVKQYDIRLNDKIKSPLPWRGSGIFGPIIWTVCIHSPC